MSVMWGWRHAGDVQAAKSKAESAEERVQHAGTEIRQLRADVDRLELLTQALWVLLKEQAKLTDEQLAEKVMQVDLSDGVLDGKVRKVARSCTQCARPVSQKHTRCLYCGEIMPIAP